jgi:anaerobic selenocysteine-containing dehydrogenase
LTLRSNDRFNTTVYGHSDRLPGLEGCRMIVLTNPAKMQRSGHAEGELVTPATDYMDGRQRVVSGLAVTPYDLPDRCLAGYYPELNRLVLLEHHEELSKTPAAKGVPVRIERAMPCIAAIHPCHRSIDLNGDLQRPAGGQVKPMGRSADANRVGGLVDP